MSRETPLARLMQSFSFMGWSINYSFGAAALGAVAIAACTGFVSDPGVSERPGSKEKPPSKTTAELCQDGAPRVAATPLRRITKAEYHYAIADLFGPKAALQVDLVADEIVAGYATNTVAAISKSVAADYASAAEKIAPLALPQVQKDSGCASDKACLRSYLPTLARKVFRRPLEKADMARYQAFFDVQANKWSANEAMTLVLEAMIASPSFIYVSEASTPHSKQLEKLDGYSVASRLSFFLWQSTPDQDLLNAAEKGGLDELEGIDKQARRMLNDPKAKRGVEAFISQWLEISELETVSKDGTAHPEWNSQLASLAYQESVGLAQSVILLNNGQFSDLMTSQQTNAQGELASFYGFSSDQPLPVERAGLLGRVAFLAAHAHPNEGSVVHRGKFIRERILCQELPPPPAGIDMSDPNRLSNPSCKGCHEAMDPIGKGFDQFDAVGSFKPLGAHLGDYAGGEIFETGETSDVDGKFGSVHELARKLSTSEDARRCMPTQWARYALRRDAPADACNVSKLADRFVKEDMSLATLMVELVKSESFRFRPVAK